MKLFIVAALVAVASAARLEHLERSYLPPDQGSSQGRFGSQPGFGFQGPARFGSAGSFGSGSQSLGGQDGFGSGSFDSNGIEPQAPGARSGSFGSSAFPGATINQYLPPDHGPSGTNGAQFSGSLQGFGNQRSQYTPQSSFGRVASPLGQYGAPSRYQQGGSQFGSQGLQGSSQFGSQGLQGSSQFGSQGLQGSSQFGSQGLQGSSQFPATSRQYLAPKSSSNYPQQAFDEETGYHY